MASGFYTWFSAHKERTRNRAQEVLDNGFDIAMAMVSLDRDSEVGAPLLDNLRDNLHDARDANLPVIIRFRYGDQVEDAPPAQIVEHIKQVSHLLYDVSDVILTMQAGFVGWYGEFHHSTHCDTVEARAEVIRALFKHTPGDMVISFRTPALVQEVLDAMPDPLDISQRIGFHNDALWSSGSEMGTWVPKTQPEQDQQKQFLRENCVLFGGETAALYDTNKSPTLIYEEMKKLPYSYISGAHRDTVIDYWKQNDMHGLVRGLMAENSK